MELKIKKLRNILLTGFVVASMFGCGSLDVYKERRDGNVVQVYSIQHVKTGRALNDMSVVAATNAGQVVGQLGGSVGSGVIAGGAMILLDKAINSTADEDEYYVSVTRPDDLLINLGSGPAKMRTNPLGAIKWNSTMAGMRVGDWVKVSNLNGAWTLLPCKLPDSGCQDKALQKELMEKSAKK